MKLTKYILCVLLLTFATMKTMATSPYNNQLDSLNKQLQICYENEEPTKETLKILRNLYELTKISSPYLALEYAGQALQIAIANEDVATQAEWNESIADIYFEQKVYYLAMDNYFQAYTQYKSINDNTRSAYTLLRYGDTYFIQNVEEMAMGNYIKADSLFRESKCDEGHAEALDRIGSVELGRYQYDKAMEVFNKSLAISQNIKNQRLTALAYSYMAEVHDQNEDYENEEKYLNLAVTKYRIAGEKYDMAKMYFKLGEMHFKNEEYDNAYTNYMRACNIFQSFGDITPVASVVNRLGRISYLQGDFGTAEIQGKKSLSMSDNNQWLNEKAEALLLLSDINNKLGRADSAYLYLNRYTLAKDSLFQAKSAESFSELQVTISTQEKEKELALAEQTIQRKQNLNTVIIVFAVIVVLFLIYAISNFRRAKKMNMLLTKTNEEINLKNTEIIRQKEIVDRVNAEVRLRNDEIEAINESINSSIKYAGRIQHAMLPNQEFIKRHFEDGFIYFHPREVVSGDFYWFSEVKSQKPPTLFRRKGASEDEGSKLILSVIDCTGHGVPGAFMSMLGDAFLNQIVNLQKITQPAKILDELHNLVRTTLQQETTENNDGMDAAIIVIDRATQTMQYAGAKNPLIYIQDGKIEKVNGDLKSIGGIQKEDVRTFTCHEIDISKPTTIYIYSDGYQDQFGGNSGRKFMAKRFRELLAENANLPFAEQSNILYKRFVEWRGNTIQMDDTTILGVKVS